MTFTTAFTEGRQTAFSRDAAGNFKPLQEPLGQPSVARQLAAGATSVNTALTASADRISIFARGGAIRFSIGSTSQTATGTSHYIASGERLDFRLPDTPNIAVIRADETDCTLEVSELI